MGQGKEKPQSTNGECNMKVIKMVLMLQVLGVKNPETDFRIIAIKKQNPDSKMIKIGEETYGFPAEWED